MTAETADTPAAGPTPPLPVAPAPDPPAGGAPKHSFARRIVDLPVWVLAALAAPVVALGLAGMLSVPAGTPVLQFVALPGALAVAFTPFGLFVVRRLPGHPLGRLMLVIGLTAACAAIAAAWPYQPAAAWVGQWAWWPPLALIAFMLLIVPDGRLPSRRWVPLAAALLAAAALTTVALAGAAALSPRPLLIDPTSPLPPTAQTLFLVAVLAGTAVMACTLGVFAALVVRWRSAGALQRRQLACLLPSAALLVIGVTLSVTVPALPAPWVLAVVALPLGLTFAVLRYQLHDLDLYVHRGVVWLVLTGLAVAVYAGTVAALGATLFTSGSPVASVLAAGAVAAVLQPAQRFAQRGVSRLLYGRRDEPYALITTWGRHLEGMADPLAVLPHIVASIVEGLRLPYAALTLTGPDGTSTMMAERGRWSGPPERFPLVAHGEQVGELLVALRRPGAAFAAAETRLLRDLAGQAALAVEACRSALALRLARDRLVLAREEERRRLRRDLHDGVASALVGTRMMTDVLRRSLPADGPRELVDTLAADLDVCTTEVRELIDGLRPAALDRGLAAALHEVAERVTEQGPRVVLRVDGDLGDLPAAVEVVAYRVVTEALTNVVKHAGARSVMVTARRDERHVGLCVTDDGGGFVGPPRPEGVGLTSIRERVAELGGQSEIVSGPTGTLVDVLLPAAP